MVEFDKLVIVTKKTWLEELTERFNTKDQAKFYIEQNIGRGTFDYYESVHQQYHESLELLKELIPANYRFQIIEREFLPNFLFNRTDLVITIGIDGLVINTAKYLDKQKILAINPDPNRIDGVLIPFNVNDLNEKLLENIANDRVSISNITMAMAELNNGQKMYGVNDLFIGHRSHMSARYGITFGGITENHSSSGIIVSTGAGSTGWMRSVVTGAFGIVKWLLEGVQNLTEGDYKFNWDANYLKFAVREPFVSRMSQAQIIFGIINEGSFLSIESKMPENGVIFSDGIEKDYVEFNSGSSTKIGVADKKVNLILK